MIEAGDDGNKTEAMQFMPSSFDNAGFYASDRLCLLPAKCLPTDAPFEAMSLWLITTTPPSKGFEKVFGVSEFVFVYVPEESTKIRDWNQKSTVRVCVLGPNTTVRPGFSHTVQIVDPVSLIPIPAARLYSSVRVVGTRQSKSSPGQLLAVRAIVASYTKSKFQRYQYFLDQSHNQPPITSTKPHSKDWAEKSLEKIDFGSEKLLNEENLVLNLPVGTRLWLQYEGFLHAAIIIRNNLSMTSELMLLRAEPEKENVSEGEVPKESSPLGAGTTPY